MKIKIRSAIYFADFFVRRKPPVSKVTPKSWTLYQRHLEIFVSGFFVLIFPLGEIAAKLHLISYI
ncbi:MAG: hypothetical protein E6779_05240, partial [Finegoldia magna]|nr:hypothetical protein [Finegoldia magna]